MDNQQINNSNQQNIAGETAVSDDLADARLQATMINQVSPERLTEELIHIEELRENIIKGYYGRTAENISEMERKLSNLGMPGIYETGRAFYLINLREEAIKESTILRAQGKKWQELNDSEQLEIADRIKWGAIYQNSWNTAFDAAKIDGATFKISPIDSKENKARSNLIFMIGNEIELALSRNSETKNLAKDNSYIDNLAEKIASDSNFVSLVNQEAKSSRNIRLIRESIEKLIEENPTNETSGNI